MGSVGSTPLRAKKAEERIRGQKVDDGIIEEAALISSEESQPTSDMNGSEAYKREIVKVLVRRTVKEAMARAMAADR
jgi:carbon-monoxide dehydrogenase medium subunit